MGERRNTAARSGAGRSAGRVFRQEPPAALDVACGGQGPWLRERLGKRSAATGLEPFLQGLEGDRAF